MEGLLEPTHLLLLNLLSQLSSVYQQENAQALLAAQLSQESKALYQNHWKSASALSRFLSESQWTMGPMLLMVQSYLLSQLLRPRGRGRRPDLYVMVDLTSIEKQGKCKQFRHWLHYFHECYGMHLVVVYLCCGQQRVPWSMAIYRGKGTTSPAQLALQLIRQLPAVLQRHYFVQLLADGGFSSKEFLRGLKRLAIPAVVGCSRSRCLQDGRKLYQLSRRGQQVYLRDLSFPVWVSWLYQKQPNGLYRKRFVLSTRPLSAASITRLGALRWRIEAFFKTMKQRFSAARFAFRRLNAVLRWFFFAWLAYLLTHWVALSHGMDDCPDWQAVAQHAAEIFFFSLLLNWHEREAQRLKAKQHSLPDFDLSAPSLI